MRSLLFSIFLVFGIQSFATSPYLPFSVDFEKSGDDRQFDIQSRVLSTPTLRFYTLQGTNVFDPQGYVSTFSFAEDWNATNMVKITGSNSSSYIDFVVSSNNFAYPIDKWYASVMLTKPADGGVFAWAYGYISLKPSPEANADASFFYTRAINGSEYGPFTGSFTNWPFVIADGFVGGYVSLVTYNAHIASQASTNSSFELRISAEEAKSTAQVGSNASYQAFITEQANTNYLFRESFNSQANTNISFGSRITANSSFTNEAHTAYGWGNHATNGYITNSSETLWPAVSNAVTVNAANGATAYGWGNHASAGYLTANTNTFSELYVANKSSLDTNISGLTQGTYTGSLTSVSYTGVTEMAIGNTYVIGFTKIGSYGTATLSIASCSLSATTAGATSNYFAYTTADTNLVLKLDGNGLSICNVSNVYVRRITNGNAHIAGSIDIGGNIRIFGAERTNWPSGVWGGIIGILADQTDLQAALDGKAGTGTVADISADLANHKTNVSVHVIAAVDGLQSSLDGKAGTGTVSDISTDLANHKTNVDVHAIAAVDGLQTALDSKAGTNDMAQAQSDISDISADLANHKTNVDVHVIAAVDGLQAALDGKASTGDMVQAQGDISDLTADLANHKTNVDVHAIASVSGLQVSLDGKASTGDMVQAQADISSVTSDLANHKTNVDVHVIAAVDGLQSALDGKASTGTVAEIAADFGAHTNNESVDIQHLTAAQKTFALSGAVPTNDPKYLASLTNETYLGTITGATIAAGSSDSVVITGPNMAITWDTNAAGGGGVGTITNILSSDTSIAIAESGGPQPDLSITSYVAGVVSDYVPINDFVNHESNLVADVLHSTAAEKAAITTHIDGADGVSPHGGNLEGGFQAGNGAVSGAGVAIGAGAYNSVSAGAGASVGVDTSSKYGGAVGCQATTTNGGSVGYVAHSDSGAAIGEASESIGGGAALGKDSYSSGGGAVGYSSSAGSGGAIGANTAADQGGAVGDSAATGNGFAGGVDAHATDNGLYDGTGIDAVQLGSGDTMEIGAFGVYSFRMMDPDGSIPLARLSNVFTLAATTGQVAALSNAYPVIEGGDNVHVTQTTTGQVLTVDAGAVDYGVTDSTAYRGDWGASVSGQVVDLHTATGSLDTAVSDLKSATNAINTRADNLDVATNNLNTVANAALPKSSTNALAVTDLQITGNSPTNGAVWIATNTAGQGKWSMPVGFKADRQNSTRTLASFETQIVWTNELYDFGGNFSSPNFTAPVPGMYQFVFYAYIFPGNAESIQARIRVNGVAKSSTIYQPPAGETDYTITPAILNIYLTNGAVVDSAIYTTTTNNILYDDATITFFSGSLIRELP